MAIEKINPSTSEISVTETTTETEVTDLTLTDTMVIFDTEII